MPDQPALDAPARLHRALLARGETVAAAESLTAGLFCATLATVPGASATLRGGVVVYATELKTALAGVPADLLGGPRTGQPGDRCRAGRRRAGTVRRQLGRGSHRGRRSRPRGRARPGPRLSRDRRGGRHRRGRTRSAGGPGGGAGRSRGRCRG